MAGKKSKDPIQQAVAGLEERINVLGRAVLGTEEFGKLMNGAVRARLEVRKTFSDQMARNLHFYNMPSQEDVILLAEQCGRIEERLVTVELLLHKLVDANTPARVTGPARTRKPKSAAAAKTESKPTATKKRTRSNAPAKKK